MAGSKTTHTEQHILNMSFDEVFEMLSVGLWAYDPINNVIRRVTVDENGQVKTAKHLFEDYQFMGIKTVGSYDYFGFKQKGGTGWYIMRKDTTDAGAWAYAYSSDGGNSWAIAWGTPDGESYGNPPDS